MEGLNFLSLRDRGERRVKSSGGAREVFWLRLHNHRHSDRDDCSHRVLMAGRNHLRVKPPQAVPLATAYLANRNEKTRYREARL